MLEAFLIDATSYNSLTPVDLTEPVYIIELGAGPGVFSFYLLKQLEELQAESNFPKVKIVYGTK